MKTQSEITEMQSKLFEVGTPEAIRISWSLAWVIGSNETPLDILGVGND